MITCDFFVVVDGKNGTAGFSKVSFSNSILGAKTRE